MTCNKIAFESKKEAKRYHHDKVYGAGKVKALIIYQCPACDQWHFTSTSKAKARRIKRNMRQKGIIK